MPYRELNFDHHNIPECMSQIKDMFRMHFEQGCRYVMKRVYQKILAVDFDSYINAGRYQPVAHSSAVGACRRRTRSP